MSKSTKPSKSTAKAKAKPRARKASTKATAPRARRACKAAEPASELALVADIAALVHDERQDTLRERPATMDEMAPIATAIARSFASAFDAPEELPGPTSETLDAIADAMAPVARVVCVPRLDAPLPPNAAETWDATLPDASELAIVAERRARNARTRNAPAGEIQGPVKIMAPLPRKRSALAEAARNASLVSAAVLLAVVLARVVLF